MEGRVACAGCHGHASACKDWRGGTEPSYGAGVSGTDCALALQLVLAAARPDANVVFGIPKMFHDPALIYLWEKDGDDIIKTTETVRRHHPFQVHLLVQSVGDDINAELLTYDLRDRIKSAFQTNRRLLGTAVN